MITGGSRGLGLKIATALAREGCRISICGRDGRRVDDRVAELTAQGYQARGTGADVMVEEDSAKILRRNGVRNRVT